MALGLMENKGQLRTLSQLWHQNQDLQADIHKNKTFTAFTTVVVLCDKYADTPIHTSLPY